MSAAAAALSALARTRSGGGIAKRRQPGRPQRADRDGDMQMGGQVPSGPKGGPRGGRPPHGANGPSHKPSSGSGGGGGGIASRTRARASGSYNKGGAAIAGFVEVKVSGWKESKSNAQEAIVFLERKAGIKFRKTRVSNEDIFIQIPIVRAPTFLDWDNVVFAGSHLRIQPTGDLPPAIHVNGQPEVSQGAQEAAAILTQVLTSRYNAETRMLNLGNLMADPILQQSGFFGQASTHTKVFPAMMKVADQQFTSNAEKRDKVVSISLEQNSLSDLGLVSSLAQTFPELKNLSLINNNFASWKDLDSWRWKFRKLEQLMLMGNPIAQQQGYREEARRRYPTLMMLDATVYPDPPVAAGARKGAPNEVGQMVPLPVPIKQHGFVHDYGVAGGFLESFFPGFDNDRESLIRQYYDQNSTFSYSINTSAPRNPHSHAKVQKWDQYIEKSRNMTRMNHAKAISNRLFVGPLQISKIWRMFPATKHDAADASKWTFASWNIPMGNVQATWIVVSGEFLEPEATGDRASMRSFDRTFVLVQTPNGMRVLNDIFVLRAWGGSAAWLELAAGAVPPQPNPQGNRPGPSNQPPRQQPPRQQQQQQQQLPPTGPAKPAMPPSGPRAMQPGAPVIPPISQPQPQPPQALQPLASAPAQPGQPNDQMKAHMLQELRRQSGLTEEFALMCLNETGWVYERAWEAFQTVKNNGTLPANAMAT